MYKTAERERERRNTRKGERRERNVAEILIISKKMEWNNKNERK
jgi:hypothetical protein